MQKLASPPRFDISAVVLALACIGCVAAPGSGDGGCYRLIPSGHVCGERETSQQYTLCANCPGLPTCHECGGPTWQIYPSIINLCDDAVASGMTECDDGSIQIQAQKHVFHCDTNNCYVLLHWFGTGGFCASAGLGGDECEG